MLEKRRTVCVFFVAFCIKKPTKLFYVVNPVFIRSVTANDWLSVKLRRAATTTTIIAKWKKKSCTCFYDYSSDHLFCLAFSLRFSVSFTNYTLASRPLCLSLSVCLYHFQEKFRSVSLSHSASLTLSNLEMFCCSSICRWWLQSMVCVCFQSESTFALHDI